MESESIALPLGDTPVEGRILDQGLTRRSIIGCEALLRLLD